MSPEEQLSLARSPIVEAVVDIDWDLPADIDFVDLEERARERVSDHYPGFRRRLRQPPPELPSGDSPRKFNLRDATYSFQFLSEEPQLLQIRRDGFSFNWFKPYKDLDEYLPEIQRTWRIFVDLVSPVAIRRVGLRYINRILLPAGEGIIDLSEYVSLGPKFPEEVSLELTSVLNQYTAVEPATGHEVNVRMVIDEQEQSAWRERQPLIVILDIAGSHRGSADPRVWENIEETILTLDRMTNAVFRSSLTERCLNLFR